MRSFAIDEPGSSVRALYATLALTRLFDNDTLAIKQTQPEGGLESAETANKTSPPDGLD